MKRFERGFGIFACGVLAAPLIYMLGFGPVAGIAWRNRAPSMGDPPWLDAAFKPIQATLRRLPGPIWQVYSDYLEWCITTFH